MKKKQEFILRNIAGDNVMLPVGKTATLFNGLIMANDTSAFIWENIEKVKGPEEMATLLCEEFAVNYEVALQDSKELINQLLIAGWIEQ